MEEADETPAPAASRRRCRPKFDVLSPYGPGFSEGNTWNYILALPHVPAGLTAKKNLSQPLSRHALQWHPRKTAGPIFTETYSALSNS